MTDQNIILSALHDDHKIGTFGDFQNKEKQDLLKVKELKNLSIFQIAKFKSSKIKTESIKIDGLDFPQTFPNVSYNNETRILWTGPDICIVVSLDKNVKDKILNESKPTLFSTGSDSDYSEFGTSLLGAPNKFLYSKYGRQPYNISGGVTITK